MSETMYTVSSSPHTSGDDNFILQGEKGNISYEISGELNDDAAKTSSYRISLTISK
jgi:hypothetical protein